MKKRWPQAQEVSPFCQAENFHGKRGHLNESNQIGLKHGEIN
ncbi:hypothetical protein [Roseiconus lacunae]|nr:hypothetical protein [Roseiconus lacunae]